MNLIKFQNLITHLFRIVIIACLVMIPTTGHSSEPQPRWTFDTKKVDPTRNLHLYQITRNLADILFDPDTNLLFSTPSIKKGEPIVPDKKSKHPIRESAYYAYALLLTDSESDRERAIKILKQVISKQDVRPNSPTRGIFAVTWEQDLDKTANPDVNWATFVGVSLADVLLLDKGRHVLPADFRLQVEDALRLSVEFTMRRNVKADYTNIAILSAAHAAGGAKLLGMKDAAVFAQNKIDEILTQAGDGLLYEYLSPTYTGVNVTAAYMAQKMSFSPAFEISAKKMIDKIWKEIVQSFHAPTLQLAGPHSRAYGDDMRNYAAILKYYIYLARPESYPIPNIEIHHTHDFIGMLVGLDLPIERRPEFSETVPSIQKLSASNFDKDSLREIYQYREGNFILSSVASQDVWTQRRNLVAYWRNEGDGVGGFRLGMCMEKPNEKPANKGWPPPKNYFYSKQIKNAALVAMTFPDEILPKEGGSCLVFAPTAMIAGTNPIVIKDGTITSYLYPITNGNGNYTELKNETNVSLNRSWQSADLFGGTRVLSYLIVFRPSEAKAPQISGLKLRSLNNKKIEAEAAVDGVPLSLSFSE